MARGLNAARSLNRRERRLVRSFAHYDLWGKTPVDLGVGSWDDVDAWWEDAMMEIKHGVSAETTSRMRSKK